MAKTVGKIDAKLGLDKKKFDKGLKGAKSSASKFGSAIKKIGGILVAAFAIRKITQWTKALVGAYRVQKEAEIKLTTIVKQRMGLGKAAVRSLLRQASAYQKIGVIGDEVQIAGMQQLATFLTQKKALEDLLPAMNNLLAQQKGYNAQAVDAVNIANMMGKVFVGQISALTRVGISFTDAQEKVMRFGTEIEKAAMLTEVITDNVGNVNEALAKTDLGKIKTWQMAFGDIKEKIGKALVPGLAKIATWATNNLPKIIDWMRRTANGIVDIVNKVIDWRNKNKDIRLANKLTFATLKTFLIKAKNDLFKFLNFNIFVFEAIALAAGGNFKAIGEAWDNMQEKNYEHSKKTAEKLKDIWKKLADFAKKTAKEWEHIAYIPIGAAPAPGEAPARPKAPARIIPVENIREGTAALADMSGVMEKNIELSNYLNEVFLNMAVIPSFIGEAFQGMSNVISDALQSTENTFKAFWKFFADFIKGMIIKLIAATIAALALAAILFMIGVVDPTKAVKFGKAFKAGFKGLSGISLESAGGAEGGIVPPGFPSDTFPTMLTSGETVIPAPNKLLRNNGLGGKLQLTTVVSGRDLKFILSETDRMDLNSF